MDKLAAALIVVFAALVFTGVLGTNAMARPPVAEPVVAVAAATPASPRGNRILGLLLALEALRAAPEVLVAR